MAVPHTQVYAETARLADKGLLSVVADLGGRRRQTHVIGQVAYYQDRLRSASGSR